MKPFLKIKDYAVSQQEFELLYDEEKDMLHTYPVPNNLEPYYQSETYISHTDSSKTFIDKIYQWVKKYSLKKKIKLINSFANDNKTLLDIGTGTGDFLLAAEKEGWQVTGVEPNMMAREKASDKGLQLIETLELLAGKKFNLISLWHVLEHLPDLENQIKKISALMREDGTLVVAVPNFKSVDAQHYQEFWAAYDVPRHLSHFSKAAIEKVFSRYNIRIVKIKPMLFDAFYVSLLSEKYKTGKHHPVSAFWVGLRSNIAALRTKEYSSLIYILRKC